MSQTLVYKNPDGTYGYVGSTEKYASEGAANYYGPRDSNYTLPTSTAYTGSPAGTNVKQYSSSGKSLESYGLDPKTGTISPEKLEQLKSGYLKTQMVNPGQQRKHKIRKEKFYTQEEIEERGIRKAGGKVLSTFAQRKVKYREARIKAGPAKPYAQLGYNKYFNPYGFANPNFPKLPEEVFAEDVRQSKLTIMEIGEGGQFHSIPKSVEIEREISQRKNISAQRIAYEKTYGSGSQVSLLAVQAQLENERIRNEQKNQLQNYTGEQGPTAQDIAKQIIQEARKAGASDVQIYQDNQPVGEIKVQGGEAPLALLLENSNEISYRFSNAQQYKIEHKTIKEQNKQFKDYVLNLQKQGAEFEIRDSSGKLIKTVPKGGSIIYDVTKASKKYGEVSVTPKYSLETVLTSFTKVAEEPSTRKIDIGFGVSVPIPGQVTGFVEGVKGGAKAMAASFLQPGALGDFSFGTQKYVEPLRQELESETALGNVLSLQPSTKPLSYQAGTVFFDIGLAVTGLRGIRASKVVSLKQVSSPSKFASISKTPSTVKIAKGFREGKLEYEIIKTEGRAELYQGTEFERSSRSVSELIKPVEPYLTRKGSVVRSIKPELPPIAKQTQKITGVGSKGEKVTVQGQPKVKIPSEKGSGEAQIPSVIVERGGPTTIIRSEPNDVFPPQAILAEEITPGQAVSLGLEPVKGLEGVYYVKSTPHVAAHISAAIKAKQIITGTDIFKFETSAIAKNPKLYAEVSRNPKLIKGKKFPEVVRPFVIRTFIGKGKYELKPQKKSSAKPIKKGRPFTPSDFSINEGKVGAGAAGRAKSLLEKPGVLQKVSPETKKQRTPRDYLGLSKQDQEQGKFKVKSASETIMFETVAYPSEIDLPKTDQPSLSSLRASIATQANKLRSLTQAKPTRKQRRVSETVQTQRSRVTQIQSEVLKERTDTLTRMIHGQKEKLTTKLKTPFRTEQLPKVLVTPVTIVTQKPVLVEIQKQTQKQIQKQIFKPKPPRKPPRETTRTPPRTPSFESKQSKKLREEIAKLGVRSEFIGNVSDVNITGAYKRSEITYGSKKVGKLARKDYNRFIRPAKLGRASVFKPSKGSRSVKPKSTKRSTTRSTIGSTKGVSIFSSKPRKIKL